MHFNFFLPENRHKTQDKHFGQTVSKMNLYNRVVTDDCSKETSCRELNLKPHLGLIFSFFYDRKVILNP